MWPNIKGPNVLRIKQMNNLRLRILYIKHIQGLQKEVQLTNEFSQPLLEKHIPMPINEVIPPCEPMAHYYQYHIHIISIMS